MCANLIHFIILRKQRPAHDFISQLRRKHKLYRNRTPRPHRLFSWVSTASARRKSSSRFFPTCRIHFSQLTVR